MEAYIQYKNDLLKANYNRFGRSIPNHEVKIDIAKYFGVSEERSNHIAKQLISDNNVSVKMIKPPTETSKKIIEKIEEEAEKMVKREFIETIAPPSKNKSIKEYRRR